LPQLATLMPDGRLEVIGTAASVENWVACYCSKHNKCLSLITFAIHYKSATRSRTAMVIFKVENWFRKPLQPCPSRCGILLMHLLPWCSSSVPWHKPLQNPSQYFPINDLYSFHPIRYKITSTVHVA
jgi:hypothetical protein